MGQLVGRLVQFIRRHHLVDQPYAQCLLGVQQAAGEQDVQRVSLAHQVHQPPHLPVADGDAKPGDGYPQTAPLGGDAQVRGDGHLASPACGETLDH